jgi:hypothetical protein
MARYRFVGETPRSFKVVFAVALINFGVWAALLMFHQFFGRRIAEGAFTYPFRFKGDGVWYFPPVLGAYMKWALVGHVVALAVLGLIVFRHRHAIVRIR